MTCSTFKEIVMSSLPSIFAAALLVATAAGAAPAPLQPDTDPFANQSLVDQEPAVWNADRTPIVFIDDRPTGVPAACPVTTAPSEPNGLLMFASGLGLTGLLGWRRRRGDARTWDA
jgi:hypothetical protein